MCGIIGIVSRNDVVSSLLESLKRLEYRGYDSAGVASLVGGRIERRRAEGKLVNLEKRLKDEPLSGNIGIGHTRWATHGGPTEKNAHPHATKKVSVVHNGIIENYQELTAEMQAKGHVFVTETDTEVVAHLVTDYLDQGFDPAEACRRAFHRLQGAFALALIFAGEENLMVGTRRGTPLAVGYGDGAMYLASDALAMAPLTNKLSYLEDGDWVVLTRDSAVIRNADDQVVERKVHLSNVSSMLIGKAGHRHFMLKEIFEQPQVIGDTINAFVSASTGKINLPKLPFDPASVPKLTIVACGTAYYVAMVAKYWFEQIARLPVEVDIGSEFRYRDTPFEKGGVAMFVSQSGETLDTLEALRHAKQAGQHILSVVNVPESTIARESDLVLYTLAGPEIGVASTKAFTTQLAVMACLVLAFAEARGTIEPAREAELVGALRDVPALAAEVLRHDDRLQTLAAEMAKSSNALYLGRGTAYPIALEGALKLKEISYIHAEAYAAGEMKHGPISLIDDGIPVVALLPSDPLFEKVLSNIQEVAARSGRVLLIADAEGIRRLGDKIHWSVELPKVNPFVAPILYALPMQLLAYHTAVAKGTDVDQPRNLAKSVTVE